jgi:hypothetical protein
MRGRIFKFGLFWLNLGLFKTVFFIRLRPTKTVKYSKNRREHIV